MGLVSFVKTVFKDNSTPAISANELNKLGKGIEDCASAIDTVNSKVTEKASGFYCVELDPANSCYIDFHGENSTKDYHARIIDSSTGLAFIDHKGNTWNVEQIANIKNALGTVYDSGTVGNQVLTASKWNDLNASVTVPAGTYIVSAYCTSGISDGSTSKPFTFTLKITANDARNTATSASALTITANAVTFLTLTAQTKLSIQAYPSTGCTATSKIMAIRVK